MKEFPRIHSLGTINIIHHHEFFYEFHPFRTDFVGDSGVGKSIITDLLQLILVGSAVYSSSTHSKDDRPFNTLVLKNTDSSDFGYAYINVEKSPKQYLVLGTYIERNSNQSQAFIIQHSLDFEVDALKPLSAPIGIDEFEKDGNWIPINELDHFFNVEKELGFKKFNRFRAYHDMLLKNNLLPIDISSPSALKDYAKILQAFARKGINVKDGVDLQEFLFGKSMQEKFFKEFETIVSSMQDSITTYRSNREELNKVEEKKKALEELFELNRKLDTSRSRYNKFYFLSLSEQKDKLISQIKVALKTHFDSKVTLKKLGTLRAEKVIALKTDLELIDERQVSKSKEVEKLQSSVQSIQEIDDLVKNQGLKDEKEIKAFYNRFHKNKHLYQVLNNGVDLLNRGGLVNDFAHLNHQSGLTAIRTEIQKSLSEKKQELDTKKALYAFNDIENKSSLANWVLTNKNSLTPEQESIIHYFQKEGVETVLPADVKDGDQYIPEPEIIFTAPIEKKDEGFLIDFGGVHTFIEYVDEYLFDGRDIEAIIQKFKEDRELLKESIATIEGEMETQNKILSFFDTVDEPKKILEAWLMKDQLIYSEINNKLLNQSSEYLDIALREYQNKNQTISSFQEVKKERDDLIGDEKLKQTLLKQLEETKITGAEEYNNHLEDFKEKYKIKTIEGVNLDFEESSFYADFKLKHTSAVTGLKAIQNIDELESQLESIGKRITELSLEEEITIADEDLAEFNEEVLNTAKKNFDKAQNEYSISFGKLIKDDNIVENDRSILEQTEDFKILAEYVLPRIFRNVAFEESEVIQKIIEYLDEISRKNAEITKNKLVHIRDLMQDLSSEVGRQTNIARKIDNIFKRSEAQISGGLKVSLKRTFDTRISTEWITKFLDELTVVNEGLFDPMNAFISEVESRNQVSIEDHIVDEYKRHSTDPLPHVTVKELLSPFSYFNLNYSIRTLNDVKNSGSTGQTYTSIALLCIAKLSLIQEEQGFSDEGLRFMSIDEAAGIGSNFDMLKDIAKEYGYQILSLSIDLNRVTEGQQTIYRLFKSKEGDYINHHPVPIFSNTEI